MKTKNFKIVQAIFEKGMTNVELVREARLSSESRLSRIINHLNEPTCEEIERIARALDKSPKALGLTR